MEPVDFMKKDKVLNISELFNLLLVYKGARKAYLTSYTDQILRSKNYKSKKRIDYIKENFPFFKITPLENFDKKFKFKSVLIHIDPLPEIKKDETRVHYLGRVLGYSKPLVAMRRDDESCKYRWFSGYYLLLEGRKYPIYAERLLFKKDLKSKKNIFNKVAKEIGGSVELELKKKLAKEEEKKILDISDIKIPLEILFNLLLVYHKARLAFYLMEWDYDIKNIKKYFPDIFTYTKVEKHYLISLDKLPEVPKDKLIIVPGVTSLDVYLGEVLGYSCPGQMITRPIYSAISYYINGERFQSEVCWNYKNIKDKTSIFNKVAKMYDLVLTSEKSKNIRVNKTRANRIIENVKDKNLKDNLLRLLTGEIKSFKYGNNKEWIFKTDLLNYKDNIVNLNLKYLK